MAIYVVTCFDQPADDFDVIGPFENYDDALMWTEGYPKGRYEFGIFPLLKPQEIDGVPYPRQVAE